MPRFLIERSVPGASALTAEQLQGITETSMCAMQPLPDYRWLHTYVAGDRLFCVHEAANEAAVREHSRRGQFPVTSVTEITTVFGPDVAVPAST